MIGKESENKNKGRDTAQIDTHNGFNPTKKMTGCCLADDVQHNGQHRSPDCGQHPHLLEFNMGLRRHLHTVYLICVMYPRVILLMVVTTCLWVRRLHLTHRTIIIDRS